MKYELMTYLNASMIAQGECSFILSSELDAHRVNYYTRAM